MPTFYVNLNSSNDGGGALNAEQFKERFQSSSSNDKFYIRGTTNFINLDQTVANAIDLIAHGEEGIKEIEANQRQIKYNKLKEKKLKIRFIVNTEI